MDVTGMSPGEILLRQEIQKVTEYAAAARSREASARKEAQGYENTASDLSMAADAVHQAITT